MKKLLEFLVGLVKVLFGVDSESPAPETPRETPVEEAVTGWEGGPPYRYIDVSRWQGTIDWEKVKSTEYRGVMLRALGNKGGNPYFDPCFEKNYAGAKAAGLDVGVYWYSAATTQAGLNAELSMLKEAVRGKELTLPVAMDVEDSRLAVLNTQELTDHVATALHEIEQLGFYAQLYTYTSFAKAHLFVGCAALRPYDVWLADYTGKTPNVTFNYNAHQHTSNGAVPGISGNVDLNVTTLNYPHIIRKKGLTRLREGK